MLTRWPVESIDPDTLRLLGFERVVRRDGQPVVEFYGPDPRVLFSDWFLDDHCFQLARSKKINHDTLRIAFTPVRKSARVDLSGELMLDAHNLALLGLTYTHENLPRVDEEALRRRHDDVPAAGVGVVDHHPVGAVGADRRGIDLRSVPPAGGGAVGAKRAKCLKVIPGRLRAGGDRRGDLPCRAR